MAEDVKPKESTIFDFGDEGGLQDAWGRPADPDADQEVSLEMRNYKSMKVEGEGGLKEELRDRQENGREIDTSQVRTKADLIAVLQADDRAQAEEAATEDEEE